MQMVSTKGDDRIGIKKQVSLQSKYAFNTLITMSQRNNNAGHAFKAYNMMLNYDIKPDVFTLTALLDVVGRSKLEIFGLNRALSIFYEMLSNIKCLPNVVTFVTMCRIVGGSVKETKKDESIRIIFMLLDEATRLSSDANQTISSEKNTIDISLINAALASIVKIYDIESAIEILKILKKSGVDSSSLTARILSKLITKVDNDLNIINYKIDGSFYKYLEFNNLSSVSTLRNVSLLQDHVYNKSFISEKKKNFLSKFSELNVNSESNIQNINEIEKENNLPPLIIESLFTREYSGCLGPDAPESLRQAVIQHDTQKLLERINPTLDPKTGLSRIDHDNYNDADHGHFLITESDFVTLIHQTRKRKWINQVSFLVDFIRNLAKYGIPEQAISPQNQLGPGKLTYEAAIDAYFSMSKVEESWNLYLEIKKDSNNFLWLYDAEFIEFLSRGFFQDGCSSYAILILKDMQSSSIVNSSKSLRKIILGFMHGLG
jgi:pentatricopeptide repeat protein